MNNIDIDNIANNKDDDNVNSNNSYNEEFRRLQSFAAAARARARPRTIEPAGERPQTTASHVVVFVSVMGFTSTNFSALRCAVLPRQSDAAHLHARCRLHSNNCPRITKLNFAHLALPNYSPSTSTPSSKGLLHCSEGCNGSVPCTYSVGAVCGYEL